MKLGQSPAQRRAAQATAASRYRARKRMGDEIAVSLGATPAVETTPAGDDPYDAAALAAWKVANPYWYGWSDSLARAWAATDDPAPTSQAEADLWRRKYMGTL